MSFDIEYHASQVVIICEYVETYEKAAMPNKAHLLDLYKDALHELRTIQGHLRTRHRHAAIRELDHDLKFIIHAYEAERDLIDRKCYAVFIEA